MAASNGKINLVLMIKKYYRNNTVLMHCFLPGLDKAIAIIKLSLWSIFLLFNFNLKRNSNSFKYLLTTSPQIISSSLCFFCLIMFVLFLFFFFFFFFFFDKWFVKFPVNQFANYQRQWSCVFEIFLNHYKSLNFILFSLFSLFTRKTPVLECLF